MRNRICALITLGLAATLGLVGCGGEDLGPRPPTPTATEALWNPCDGLTTSRLERLLGVALTARTGTDDAPLCSFASTADGATVEGGTVIDVNYQLYDGTLDDLFASFGELDDSAEVVDVDLPDADGARMVISTQNDTLTVTGFVKNGELVQLVNAIDPAPYAERRVLGTMRVILRDLSAKADASGLSAEPAQSAEPEPQG